MKTEIDLQLLSIVELDEKFVVDELGRTLTRSEKFPDISVYLDAQGNDYGVIQDKKKLVRLIGDLELAYKWGVDQYWPDFPLKPKQESRHISFLKENLLTDRRIFIRTDWLGEHSTEIAIDRAAKPAPPITCERTLLRECTDECIFSPQNVLKVTPEPRITHGDTITFQDNLGKVVTFPNLFPFMYPHYVTAPPDHPAKITEIKLKHIITFLNAGSKLAQLIQSVDGVVGMIGIWNWGELAATSQGHIHFQWGGRTPLMITHSVRERKAIQLLGQELRADPFDLLIQTLQNTSLFCWENEVVFVHTPFAPTFPDQVDIVLKKSIPNLWVLPNELIEPIAEGIWRTIICLATSRAVTDFNVIVHQDDFDLKSEYYRLHFHILPRNKRREGGLEWEGSYVVDIFPETTARFLRQAMGKEVEKNV